MTTSSQPLTHRGSAEMCSSAGRVADFNRELIPVEIASSIDISTFSQCSLDIFIEVNGVKIDIEYDGSYWHQNQQKDIKRDKFLQSHGFKTLRVRSGHLLPNEQELFDAIDYLVSTEHHFKEIVLSDWKKVDKYESLFDSAAI